MQIMLPDASPGVLSKALTYPAQGSNFWPGVISQTRESLARASATISAIKYEEENVSHVQSLVYSQMLLTSFSTGKSCLHVLVNM